MAGRRQEQRDIQGKRILEAASKLFSERGPDDVTMAEVAAEAGVARATVFNHFGSKRVLIEGITAGVLGTYQKLLKDALEDVDTPTPQQVRTLFELMGRGIEADPRFFRGVFREIAKFMMGLEEGGSGQTARQQALVRVSQLLTRGQGRNQISKRHEALDLARAFDSLVFGTITHWLYDDGSDALHIRMERAAEVLLAGVET